MLPILAQGCGGPSREAAERPCEPAFDPAVESFPARASIRFAERFRIDYGPHHKLITIFAEAGPERHLLLPCGAGVPEGFEGAHVVRVPVRSVITTSTTELPHLVSLGLVDRLIGHDKLAYITSPELVRRAEAGELLEVGSGPRLDLERVVGAAPDLLLADQLSEVAAGGVSRLRQAGIATVVAPAYLEASPLGRAEWVKLVAAFFNVEARAEEVFWVIAARYEELAAIGRGAEERPTVLTGAPEGGTWYVPGGGSFVAQLLADAGARYLWADEPSAGSLPLDLEAVYARALDADFWLQPGSFHSLAELRAADERFSGLAATRSKQVYNNDAQRNEHGGNAYWELGTARPDLVLADFVHMLHPNLLGAHELVFHRRLE